MIPSVKVTTDEGSSSAAPTSPAPPGASNQLASVVAILTALGTLVAAWRGYEGGQDTQRAAYEVLRLRSELQEKRLDEVTRQLGEQSDWMAEMNRKLEVRATTTERVLRKVVKSKGAAIPAELSQPPAPPPPPALVDVRPAAPLPSFEQLAQ